MTSILVVGAGATGGFFGLRLEQAGRDVTFLVRPSRAAALRERGLRVVGPGHEERIEPKTVTAKEIERTYDVVLLSVKATALRQALEDVAPAVGPQTRIVPFLNGMAHIDALTERFGARRVLGGVVKVVTQLDANGDIVQLTPLAGMEIGSLGAAGDEAPDPRLAEVAAALDGAGFDFSVTQDAEGAMWGKWAMIATVGALTCLMRAPVGDVVAAPGGEQFARALLAEAAAVAAFAGHTLPPAQTEAIAGLVTAPGSPLASSMYRDLGEGAGTEVEQILGDLVARARRHGVSTPLLDLATLHLRVYEHRRAQAG